MDPKLSKRIARWNARNVYLLASGIMFIVLGCVIFVRGKGFMNLLWAGLMGVVFCAYGVYRLFMFRRLYREAGKDERP